VIPWLLEREYRQHRGLDAELPTTYSKWLTSLDRRLQREVAKQERVVKMVIHPAEIETWARREGRQVNEQARSDYAALMWRIANARKRSNGVLAETGCMMGVRRWIPGSLLRLPYSR
jgi:hypothetical protein